MATSKTSSAATTVLIVAAVLGVLYELWNFFRGQAGAAQGAGSAVGGAYSSGYSPYGTYGSMAAAPPTDAPTNALLGVLAALLAPKQPGFSLSNNLPSAGFGGLLPPSNQGSLTGFVNAVNQGTIDFSNSSDNNPDYTVLNDQIPYQPVEGLGNLPTYDLPSDPYSGFASTTTDTSAADAGISLQPIQGFDFGGASQSLDGGGWSFG